MFKNDDPASKLRHAPPALALRPFASLPVPDAAGGVVAEKLPGVDAIGGDTVVAAAEDELAEVVADAAAISVLNSGPAVWEAPGGEDRRAANERLSGRCNALELVEPGTALLPLVPDPDPDPVLFGTALSGVGVGAGVESGDGVNAGMAEMSGLV
jgi:hypothetical protein